MDHSFDHMPETRVSVGSRRGLFPAASVTQPIRNGKKNQSWCCQSSERDTVAAIMISQTTGSVFASVGNRRSTALPGQMDQ